MYDSITRRGEGTGSLKRRRAAPQQQRFRHLSTWSTIFSGQLDHDSFTALNVLIIIRCRHAVLFHWPHGNSCMLILHRPQIRCQISGLRYVRAGAATLNWPMARGNQLRTVVPCTITRRWWSLMMRKRLVLRQDYANHFNYPNYIDYDNYFDYSHYPIAGRTSIDNQTPRFLSITCQEFTNVKS